MNLTNKLNLPQPLVDAVNNDSYSRGKSHISVTQLIDSPYIRHLEEKHRDDIEEDVADRIWALMGQSIHTILERAETTALAEKRLYMEVEGKVLSGQFDRLALLPDGLLQDYKMCSVWEVIYGLKKERAAQLNVLAELCEVNNYPIKQLQIVAILRDWQLSKAKYDKQYPQQQVVTIDVPLWADQERQQYIKQRMALHFSDDIPPCTDEERWLNGEAWALMKKGGKKAIKLFKSQEDAEKITLANNQYIEHRPGQYRRCEDYCSVSDFCSQWQAYLKKKEAA